MRRRDATDDDNEPLRLEITIRPGATEYDIRKLSTFFPHSDALDDRIFKQDDSHASPEMQFAR